VENINSESEIDNDIRDVFVNMYASVPEIITASLVGNQICSLSVLTWDFTKNTKFFFKNDA
jgi:hypothetical protein